MWKHITSSLWMNTSYLICWLFCIHNHLKVAVLTPHCFPCTPFIDCVNTSTNCVNISTNYIKTFINYTNTFTNYADKSVDCAHTSNDYANTSADLADTPICQL
jgi:hypothetical protein